MFLGLPLPHSVHPGEEWAADLGFSPWVLDPSFTEPQPELFPTAWFCPGMGSEVKAAAEGQGRNASPGPEANLKTTAASCKHSFLSLTILHFQGALDSK